MNKQRKKLVPNIVRGGTAIPIGDNFFFMKGRKHEQGGIDIGKDLEVEGGEVMEITPKQMKVYSSVPFLNGNSPAELVMEGINPNKVFKAQEDFKDRNHINDDGTRKKRSGGMKKIPRAKDGIEYTIKKGDTLSEIAKKLLGDANRYNEIAKLNNISDANKIYYGQKIIIPKIDDSENKVQLVSSSEIEPSIIIVDKKKEEEIEKQKQEYIKNNTGFRGLINSTTKKLEDLTNNIGNKIQNTTKQIKYYFDRGINVKLRGKSNDPVTELSVPKDTTSTQSDIMYPSIIGDSIPVSDNSDNQIYRAESILLNGLKFGARNRGDLKDIKTKGAIITSLNEFVPYSFYNSKKVNPNSSFIGIDKNGNFKAGTISDFEEGDLLAQTSSNRIKGFAKNEDGSYKFASAVGNSKWDTPLTIAIDETTGKDRIGQAMRILNERGSKGDRYGNIEGGRFIIKVGNEYRLISGSVKNIEDEMNRLKKAYGVDNLQVFNLDNGTFNLGYIPTDNLIDSNELKTYDARNQSGGHFLYIKKFGGSMIRNKKKNGGQREIDKEYLQLLLDTKKNNPLPTAKAKSNSDIVKFDDKIKSSLIPKNNNTKQRNIINYTDLILDGVNGLTNIAGNIASGVINNKMLDSLEYSPAPTPIIPTKLKTRINITPQLQRLYEDLGIMENEVNNNTSSSRVALARNQRLRRNTSQAVNELYGNKENIETQLINKDRLNQQNVSAQNVQAYNNWLKGRTEFENNVRNLKSENKVALAQGITGSISDFINNILSRNNEARTLAYLQRSNPYAVEALSEDAMRDLLKNNGYIRVGRCGTKIKRKK